MDQVGKIIVESTDIQMVVMKYYEQLYINKFGHLLSCVSLERQKL